MVAQPNVALEGVDPDQIEPPVRNAEHDACRPLIPPISCSLRPRHGRRVDEAPPGLGVRLTPHKLRHAYGRQCVDLGVDIRIIAEALGHESLESTKIYTQVSFQRTRRIAELFGSPGEVK